MPSGRVKVFHADRNFGFIVDDEGGRDLYVHSDDSPADIKAGDLVEFELSEDDDKPRARAVKITRSSGNGQPIGQVLTQPPSYEELEQRERERRAARRRRR